MKNLDKDIEKKLQGQFNQQDFEIQDAWLDDMSSQLDDYNRKNRKFLFFWLFGGALLLSAIGGYAWNGYYLENKEEIMLVSSEKNRVNQVEENKSSLHQNYEFKYTELACEPHELIENSLINKEKKTLSSKSNVKKILKSSVTSSSSFSSKNTFSNRKKGLTIINNSSKIQLANNITNNKSSVTKATNLASIKESKNLVNNIDEPFFKQEELVENSTETIEALISSEKRINSLGAKEEVKAKESIELDENPSIEILDSLEELSAENEGKDSIQEIVENETKEEKTIKPKKNLGLKLSLNTGASFLFRTLKSTSQNEKRITEESNKITWNLNLELYKTFANNLILGTGVNITNYGEHINYSSISEIIKDTTYQAAVFNYLNVKVSNMGASLSYDTTAILYYDTTTIITDSLYENTDVQKANGTTNFTYVEIPILVGFQVLNTKKWKLSALTGVSAGFLINSKGSYLNKENQLESAVNEKVIFNYLLSAQLDYNIYKNLNLSLVPHFKYNLNNVSVYNETNKRYANFGLNAGVSLDF